MSRKRSSIQVELHMPESPEELRAIQEIFDKTYCRCIARRLENSDLTADEKKYVVERIMEIIESKSMPV